MSTTPEQSPIPDTQPIERPVRGERGRRLPIGQVVKRAGAVAVSTVVVVGFGYVGGVAVGGGALDGSKSSATAGVEIDAAVVGGTLIEGQDVCLLTADYGVSAKGGMEIQSNRLGNVLGKAGAAVDEASKSKFDYAFNPVRKSDDGKQFVEKVGFVKLCAEQGAIDIDVQKDEVETNWLERFLQSFSQEDVDTKRRVVVTIGEGALGLEFQQLRGLDSKVAVSSPGNGAAIVRSLISDLGLDNPNEAGQNTLTWDDIQILGGQHLVESSLQFVEKECAEPLEESEFLNQGLESSVKDYTRAMYAEARPDARLLADEEIIVQIGERVISANPAIDKNEKSYQAQLDKAIAEAAKANVTIAIRPTVTSGATCTVNFDASSVVSPDDPSLYDSRLLEVKG